MTLTQRRAQQDRGRVIPSAQRLASAESTTRGVREGSSTAGPPAARRARARMTVEEHSERPTAADCQLIVHLMRRAPREICRDLGQEEFRPDVRELVPAAWRPGHVAPLYAVNRRRASDCGRLAACSAGDRSACTRTVLPDCTAGRRRRGALPDHASGGARRGAWRRREGDACVSAGSYMVRDRRRDRSKKGLREFAATTSRALGDLGRCWPPTNLSGSASSSNSNRQLRHDHAGRS